MVGVSVALHLQRRGRDVALIDRRDPGEETSYGNAGLIQREAVIPYTFPREFGTILSYAMNNRRDAVYHLSALPRLFMKSTADGAKTSVYCATSVDVANQTGRYYADSKEKRPSRVADDATLAKTLWDKSAAWVGLEP